MRSAIQANLKRMSGLDQKPNRRYPHQSLPLLNQTHDDAFSSYKYTPSSYRFGYPLPISPAEKLARPDDDPVLRLVRQKIKLNQDLQAMHTEYEYQMSIFITFIIQYRFL